MHVISIFTIYEVFPSSLLFPVLFSLTSLPFPSTFCFPRSTFFPYSLLPFTSLFLHSNSPFLLFCFPYPSLLDHFPPPSPPFPYYPLPYPTLPYSFPPFSPSTFLSLSFPSLLLQVLFCEYIQNIITF